MKSTKEILIGRSQTEIGKKFDQKIFNLIANQKVPLTHVASFFESEDRLEIHQRVRNLLLNEDLKLTEDWMLELPPKEEIKKDFTSYVKILYENFLLLSSGEESSDSELFREDLDVIWEALTKEERELTGILGEDYYELFEPSKKSQSGGPETTSEKFLELFYEKYDPKNRETLLELHKWAQDHTFESWAMSLLIRGFLWLKYDGMREIADQFLNQKEVKNLSDSIKLPFFSVSSEYYDKNSMVVYDRAVREGRVSLTNAEGKVYAAISVPRDNLPVVLR